MSASTKRQFEQILNTRLGPVLHEDGFVGHSCQWVRIADPVVNCIEVQSRTDHDACCVNLGVHLTFLPVAGGSAIVDRSEISESDCEVQNRLAWQGESEHWWAYSMPEQSVDDLVRCYRECGRPFFGSFGDFPHPFIDVRPDSIDDDALSMLFPIMTRVRKVLLFARVHDFLGNEDLAKQFSQLGKDIAGRAVGPKAAFREILRKYNA